MVMVPGAGSFEEVLEITSEIYRAAGRIMMQMGKRVGVADEGGWWPVFDSNEEALETLVQAIVNAGEIPGERAVISPDIAASMLYFGSPRSLVYQQHAQNDICIHLSEIVYEQN